jgi:hypothetical protein
MIEFLMLAGLILVNSAILNWGGTLLPLVEKI